MTDDDEWKSMHDTDNDNGHSFIELSVHGALTCLEGQGEWNESGSVSALERTCMWFTDNNIARGDFVWWEVFIQRCLRCVIGRGS